MRKLKLQMHLSLDNYVNMEQGGTNFKWDEEVIKFCVDNLENTDTILLGRNTAQDLIPFWDDVAANTSHPDFALGKRISEIPKTVFSNTITQHHWKNTTTINGNINDEIIKFKESKGKDILVYGGASFAASLIQNDLVDEFYFLLNPFCLGNGSTIFKPNKDIVTFTLVKSMPFPCGTVMLCYKPNN
jgi:dihydrofolate reductase